MEKQKLIHEINRLKVEKNAIILAHNYQRPEIQVIADYLGDSLELAKTAATLKTDTIIFCGVHFMAESAKILCPEKTVLLPELEAGCPLADCATADQVKKMRKKHPEAVFIAYINTSAAVKAECDVCCTSANAMKIIDHFKDREIVYLPDKNLAAYAEYIMKKPIIKWPGQCYVHDNLIQVEPVAELIKQFPDALVLAHPEAPMDVLDLADVVTGTSGMIRTAHESSLSDFILLTERGLADRMSREMPDKRFHALPGAICGQMKVTTLRSVFEALTEWKNAIEVDSVIAEKARKTLDRMLEMS